MMPISALSALLPNGRGRTLRTVAQSAGSRNLLILLGAVASCVVNGDTVTAILKQSTWLVVVVTVLIAVRTVETLVRHRIGAGLVPLTSEADTNSGESGRSSATSATL
ncbi:hypothetical protein [Streptomyces sp. NPDC051992]|uniref:hypothetical protein n=1 Tax=Streptomyces sp. NPDC051992 TaxID=3161012 RepID=UPI00343BB97A